MTAKQTKRFKKIRHTQKGGNLLKGIQNAFGLRVKRTQQTTATELDESNHSTKSTESTGSTASNYGLESRFAANNEKFPGGKKNVLQRKNIKRTKRKRVKNRNV